MTRPDEASAEARQDTLAEQVGQVTQMLELADPDDGASAFDRRINRAAEAVGTAVLATIASLVFVNAVGRYLAASPVIWAEETVIALVPWLAMSGVFLSVRRRQLIRIGYYTFGLPLAVRSAIDVFIHLLSAATFVVVAFYSFQYVSLFGSDVTTYLKLPTGWFTSAMLVGAVGVALAFLVNAFRDHRVKRASSGAEPR